MAAQAPIYNAAGLLTSYRGQSPTIPLSLSPRYDTATGLLTDYSPAALTGAKPIAPAYSSALSTGSPGTGTLVTGNGAPSLTPGQKAGQQLLDDTQTIGEVKNQAIADAGQHLLNKSQELADQTSKSFDQYLAESNTTNAGIKTQVAQDTSTLNALPSQTSAALNAINQNYANTIGNISNTYAGINANNAATVQGDIAQLGTIDSNYATAAQKVADNALSYAGQQIAKYQGGSGTPTSNSGDLTQRYIQASENVNLPVQAQIYANNRSDLQNYITPLQQQLYGQNVAQAVGYDTTRANQIASMQTGSAEQIAALTQAVAGRSVNEALQYMQSIGIPLQVAQSVLSGATNQLGQLSNIDLANTNYAIAGDYQNPGFQLPNYPNSNPKLSGSSSPVTYGQQPMGANGQPVPVGQTNYAVDGAGNPIYSTNAGGNQVPIVTGSPDFYNYGNYANPNSPSWPTYGPSQTVGPSSNSNQAAYNAALQQWYVTGTGAPPNPVDFGLNVNGSPTTGATVTGGQISPDYAAATSAGSDYVGG